MLCGSPLVLWPYSSEAVETERVDLAWRRLAFSSHTRFHNASHQIRGQRSIWREAEGPFPCLERLQFGGKLATDFGTRYEEAAMIPKRAIIDEHPVVSKRGHLVADNLLCSGCSGLDGPP